MFFSTAQGWMKHLVIRAADVPAPLDIP